MKKYHPGKAIVAAIINAVPFIVLPVLFLRAFQTFLPSLIPVPIDIEFGVDLQTLETLVISLGAAVVAMAFMTALFNKGLLGRPIFGSLRQVAKFGWVYFLMNAGFITLLVTLGGEEFGQFPIRGVAFGVHFEQLLYILYFAILFMIVYFAAEYLVHRKVVQEQYYVEPSYY